MNRNPYAPPGADRLEALPDGRRPRQVVIATAALMASLLLSFGVLMASWLGWWAPARQSESPDAMAFMASYIAILATTVITAIGVWLVYQIYLGANWARWSYTAFALMGYVIALKDIEARLAAPLLTQIDTALQILLEVIAFYLLYTAPGRYWFSRRRKAAQ